MGDSREIRLSTSEVKFVVSGDAGARIREWARHHLEPDPHGQGPYRDEYRTVSLYYDTPVLDVFHRRGSFGRSKYRIRRYGDDGVVFLERKLREPGILIKRRTMAPLSELHRLGGDALADPWAGTWFHRRLLARGMRPACQVSYSRTARCLGVNGRSIRLTVDETVCAAPAAGHAIVDVPGAPIADGTTIVELKFAGALPALFKQLVEAFALEPARLSKYRGGMLALGRVAPTPAEVGASGKHANA
jgi:VTC domain-containing protein